MPSSPDIPRDAIVLRHIPGGSNYQQPPHGRITSSNFELRDNEAGVSVSISSAASRDADARHLLQILKVSVGSRIAFAGLQEVENKGLIVIRNATLADPNHALLMPQTCDLRRSRAIRKQVATLFRFCTEPIEIVPPPVES